MCARTDTSSVAYSLAHLLIHTSTHSGRPVCFGALVYNIASAASPASKQKKGQRNSEGVGGGLCPTVRVLSNMWFVVGRVPSHQHIAVWKSHTARRTWFGVPGSLSGRGLRLCARLWRFFVLQAVPTAVLKTVPPDGAQFWDGGSVARVLQADVDCHVPGTVLASRHRLSMGSAVRVRSIVVYVRQAGVALAVCILRFRLQFVRASVRRAVCLCRCRCGRVCALARLSPRVACLRRPSCHAGV